MLVVCRQEQARMGCGEGNVPHKKLSLEFSYQDVTYYIGIWDNILVFNNF